MTTLISMMTSANTMIRTSTKTETSLQTSKSCLTLTMTWPLMMKEYHEALLGYREARDLMKEARVARGFHPVVVPIRSDQPTGRGTGDSSSVKNVSGKTGRGKGGRGSKGSGRPSNSRGRGKKGKGRGRSGTRDGPSNSQVCFKCGSSDHWARDCPKMDDGSSSPKKRNLGAYAYGAWTCNNPDHSREKCSSDSFQMDPLCCVSCSRRRRV